jgi:hypothetical protein
MNNLTVDLNVIRWEGMEWTQLIQNSDKCWTVVNMVMKLQIP